MKRTVNVRKHRNLKKKERIIKGFETYLRLQREKDEEEIRKKEDKIWEMKMEAYKKFFNEPEEEYE